MVASFQKKKIIIIIHFLKYGQTSGNLLQAISRFINFRDTVGAFLALGQHWNWLWKPLLSFLGCDTILSTVVFQFLLKWCHLAALYLSFHEDTEVSSPWQCRDPPASTWTSADSHAMQKGLRWLPVRTGARMRCQRSCLKWELAPRAATRKVLQSEGENPYWLCSS